MKFVAIDFETANQKWDSVCALGMAMVENGKIVNEYYSLINPEDYFSSFNMDIHGIKALDVVNMPKFSEVSKQVWPWLAENLVIAHNASFDVNVLRKVTQKYGLQMPKFSYACTCKIAKLTWTNLENYRLSTVAGRLALKLQHHNAMSDARVCAEIMVQALQEHGCSDIAELAAKTGYKVKKV